MDLTKCEPQEAARLASKYEGDYAELGAGFGVMTIQLLRLANEFKKKVLVVDPFESGWGEMPKGYQYPKDKFLSNITQYHGLLNLHEVTSLCSSSEKFLSVPLCFAFVDGLQYKGAVLSDLRIVSHAKIICVDDMNRETGQSQVPEAVKEFCKLNKRELIINDRWAYII